MQDSKKTLIQQIQRETASASYYRIGDVLMFLGDFSTTTIAIEQEVFEREGDWT